jgi:hypothetical protein
MLHKQPGRLVRRICNIDRDIVTRLCARLLAQRDSASYHMALNLPMNGWRPMIPIECKVISYFRRYSLTS